MRSRAFYSLALLLAAPCLTARADNLAYFSFAITGSTSTTPAFSFVLPDTPTGYNQDPGEPTFTTLPCGPVQLGTTNITSCIKINPDGFNFNSGDDVVSGAHIYTGAFDSPTFVAGTYGVRLENFYTLGGIPLGFSDGTLTINVTPEPSSFALLGTGLLGVVGVARKRFA